MLYLNKTCNLISYTMPSKNKISFLRNEVNMKNYKKIISLILVVFSLSASQANAESKWWEKVFGAK